MKIAGISSLVATEPDILLGVIYPPPPTCNIRYKKHTCNRRVNGHAAFVQESCMASFLVVGKLFLCVSGGRGLA